MNGMLIDRRMFSCEYCEKGFLHQNQLYAHHKQRHATENQLIKEDYDAIQLTNEFADDSTDFFF